MINRPLTPLLQRLDNALAEIESMTDTFNESTPTHTEKLGNAIRIAREARWDGATLLTAFLYTEKLVMTADVRRTLLVQGIEAARNELAELDAYDTSCVPVALLIAHKMGTLEDDIETWEDALGHINAALPKEGEK